MTTKATIKRVVRTPLHQRGPLSVLGDKDPDFHYRFVNDTGSRVYNYQQAGYELVSDSNITVGDSRVSDVSDLGSTRRVMSNNGTSSVLMRIPKQYFDEDQKRKNDLIDEQEKAMKQNAISETDYGKIEIVKK